MSVELAEARMTTKCSTCGVTYDDAKCVTYCPHNQFLTDQQFQQKDKAISLLGKKVHFAHQTPENVHTVQAVVFDGMIEISGMAGQFAPHLFKVVE